MDTRQYALDAFNKRDIPGNLGASLTLIAEGIRLKVYKDSVGKRTVGIGYNLDAHGEAKSKSDLMAAGVPAGDVEAVYWGRKALTVDQALSLFISLMNKEYVPTARRGYGQGYDELPENAKAVLNDLCYNAGSLKNYMDAVKCIRAGDFKKAGESINLTFKNPKTGLRVRNERRMNMYKKMLTDPEGWGAYLKTI